MEAPASWSLDSPQNGFEKMESGLNARAIDFAKFGRIYLLGGSWQGRQLVPKTWVQASTSQNRLAGEPKRGKEEFDYGYMWWLDTEVPGRFAALGNMGQIIYVAPDRDVVLLRFGTTAGISHIEWLRLMREFASQIQ